MRPTSIIADASHQWVTDAAAAAVTAGSGPGRAGPAAPRSAPPGRSWTPSPGPAGSPPTRSPRPGRWSCPACYLLVPPWLLGAWLAGGAGLEARLPVLRDRLDRLGLLPGPPHIPRRYLRACLAAAPRAPRRDPGHRRAPPAAGRGRLGRPQRPAGPRGLRAGLHPGPPGHPGGSPRGQARDQAGRMGRLISAGAPGRVPRGGGSVTGVPGGAVPAGAVHPGRLGRRAVPGRGVHDPDPQLHPGQAAGRRRRRPR